MKHLSVGTPIDSAQVQSVKSLEGAPVGWAFINQGFISFALSSRKLLSLKRQNELPQAYYGEGGAKLTKQTLQELVRVTVELPKDFLANAESSEDPLESDGTFGIIKMAQPRFQDYYDHPEINKQDDFITPYSYYSTSKQKSDAQKYYQQYIAQNYTAKSSEYYPPHKTDFYAEYPPLPSYLKKRYNSRTLMIDLNIPAVQTLLDSELISGFQAEGCDWVVFSVSISKIKSVLYFDHSTQPLTFLKSHATKRPPIDFFGMFNWLNLRKC